MTEAERETMRDALGLWGKNRRPWRNRSAHNDRNPVTTDVHYGLVALGHLVRGRAQDYGRMRVYRVTAQGAAAMGRRLPKKLAALVPETPTAH